MLNFKDKIKAVLTVVKEQNPDSYLLVPTPWGPLTHLSRAP